MPRYQVYSAENLESLNTELTLEDDRIGVTANCVKLSAAVTGRKGNNVRLGRAKWTGSIPMLSDCEVSEEIPMKLSNSIPGWIIGDRGGVINVLFDPATDTLEITRGQSNALTFRFERVDGSAPN